MLENKYNFIQQESSVVHNACLSLTVLSTDEAYSLILEQLRDGMY